MTRKIKVSPSKKQSGEQSSLCFLCRSGLCGALSLLYVAVPRQPPKMLENFSLCLSRVVDGADPYSIKSKYSQQTKQKIYTLSRKRTHSIHARHTFICGRADNACTNLLGYLVRYVRTRGMAEAEESDKTVGFRSAPCHTRSPRTASCD